MQDVHELTVVTPMLRAFREGVTGYQPIFDELSLGVECQDAKVSLDNLRKLMKSGRHARSFQMGTNQNVLVQFAAGEQYLATGFAVGSSSYEVAALAEIASLMLGGTDKEWFRSLSGMPQDYTGPLDRQLLGTPLAS